LFGIDELLKRFDQSLPHGDCIGTGERGYILNDQYDFATVGIDAGALDQIQQDDRVTDDDLNCVPEFVRFWRFADRGTEVNGLDAKAIDGPAINSGDLNLPFGDVELIAQGAACHLHGRDFHYKRLGFVHPHGWAGSKRNDGNAQ
jgi:hypothetical protein